MIFDAKMDGHFTYKSRIVSRGHNTDPPSDNTYSSVLIKDIVRIVFLIYTLNDLDISASDIGNDYLNAPCQEKIWKISGSEFGNDKVCFVTIVRALHGLKSSGTARRAMLTHTLRNLGYKLTRSDPGIWINMITRPDRKR